MIVRSLRSRDVFCNSTAMGKSKDRGGSGVKYKTATIEEHLHTETPRLTGGTIAVDLEDERTSSRRKKRRKREERLDLPECLLSTQSQTADWDWVHRMDLASPAAAERRNREESVPDLPTDLDWDDVEAVDLVDVARKKRRKREEVENPSGTSEDVDQDRFSERDLVSSLAAHRKEEAKGIEFRKSLIRVSSELMSKEDRLMAQLVEVQKEKRACSTSICEVDDRLATCRAYIESTEVELAAVRDKRRAEEALRRNALERELRKDYADAVLELEVQKENNLCQICMNCSRNALVLPCMHFLYCSDCLQKHQRTRNDCPTCRGPITALLLCKLSSD